jgi:TonB family protein
MRTRFGLMAVLLVALIAPRASGQTFNSFSGTISDQLGASLPAVRLVLTNTESGAKYEIRSTSVGAFEFVGLPPGAYVLDAALPGFRTLREEITVAGRNVSRALTLQLGELEETVHVVYVPGTTTSAAPPANPGAGQSARQAFRIALERCGSGPAGSASTGGSIRPPRQVRMVPPQYPVSAGSAGIGGTVRLQARIGTDGYVRDVESTNQEAHPDLVNAAIEAVRLWEYDGTLLDCVPVEVMVHVTLQFDVR